METYSAGQRRRNSCLLVVTAFIWGIAFVAQSAGGLGVVGGGAAREGELGCVLIFGAVILAQLPLAGRG